MRLSDVTHARVPSLRGRGGWRIHEVLPCTMKELMGKVAVTVGAPMPKAIPLNVARLVSAWQTFRFKLGGPEPLDLDVYFKVLDQAVDLINADFARYAHYIAAIAKDKISGNELDGRFIRYTHARRY
jgi:hypothetical protein